MTDKVWVSIIEKLISVASPHSKNIFYDQTLRDLGSGSGNGFGGVKSFEQLLTSKLPTGKITWQGNVPTITVGHLKQVLEIFLSSYVRVTIEIRLVFVSSKVFIQLQSDKFDAFEENWNPTVDNSTPDTMP